jgi:hypothetical protein
MEIKQKSKTFLLFSILTETISEINELLYFSGIIGIISGNF